MTDAERISRMAELWVTLGGDADGIEWCWRQIRDAVKKITEEAEEATS